MADDIDAVLEKLARDVESAVHGLYRGDMRQATAKVRTGHLIRAAADALRSQATGVDAPLSPGAMTPAARSSAQTTVGAIVGWSRSDGEAVMKCVTAWLSMGAPSSASPDSKCVAGGREMVPTWGERERARAALRALSAP